MGVSGIGFGELLILLAIVLLLFGSNKLSRVGSDLGTAIRGFRSALQGDTNAMPPPSPGQKVEPEEKP